MWIVFNLEWLGEFGMVGMICLVLNYIVVCMFECDDFKKCFVN